MVGSCQVWGRRGVRECLLISDRTEGTRRGREKVQSCRTSGVSRLQEGDALDVYGKSKEVSVAGVQLVRRRTVGEAREEGRAWKLQ